MATATDTPATPPAFPPWMRAADPILAREDTNGLFQAFRARRLRHGRVAIYLRDNWQDLLVTCASLTMCFLAFKKIGGPGMGAAIMWGALGLKFGLGKLHARTRRGLPMRASEFFGPKAIGRENPQVALDLWLCPLSGAEVAEAIYLEEREKTLVGASANMLVVTIVAAVLYLVGVAPPLAQLWKEVLPIAMMAVVIFRSTRSWSGTWGIAAAHRTAQAVAEGWQLRVGGGRWNVDPHLRQRMRGALAGVAIMLILVVFFCLSGRLLPGATKSFWVWVAAERAMAVTAILALVLVAMEVAAVLSRRWNAEPDFHRLWQRASAYYQLYMRREFLGDEE